MWQTIEVAQINQTSKYSKIEGKSILWGQFQIIALKKEMVWYKIFSYVHIKKGSQEIYFTVIWTKK